MFEREFGYYWWFYSEKAFSTTTDNRLDNTSPFTNLIKWISFPAVDVFNLEKKYKVYVEGGEGDSRFEAVLRDSREYLKVDFEKMRMKPIYWQSIEEHFVRRSCWFIVPKNFKYLEGWPVMTELNGMLEAKYEENKGWINQETSKHVEKIVDLEEIPASEKLEIEECFVIFRQGGQDLAKLFITKKSGSKSKREQSSKGTSVGLNLSNQSSEKLSLANYSRFDQIMPLSSMSPMSSTFQDSLNESVRNETVEFTLIHSFTLFFHLSDSMMGTECLPQPIIQFPINPQPSPTHLIFVVHGIGQRVARKFGYHFHQDCNNLRKGILDAAIARNYPPSSICLLPVSWRTELDLTGNFHYDQPAHIKTSFEDILQSLTLNSIPAIRNITSDAALDILFYMSPFHFAKIINLVRNEIVHLYSLFRSWHPNFTGSISLIGHSLGSAIIADILSITIDPSTAQSNPAPLQSPLTDLLKSLDLTNVRIDLIDLPFQVDKFFALGSPLGVFHLLNHNKPIGCLNNSTTINLLHKKLIQWSASALKSSSRSKPSSKPSKLPKLTTYNCSQFYNVFHPYDPVAHRFEPLILPSSTQINPLKIPYTKAGFTKLKLDFVQKIKQTRESLQSLWQNCPSWLRSPVNRPLPSASPLSDDLEDGLAALNSRFKRVDFILQDSFIENPYLSAISAHFCYWNDPDIAAFIFTELQMK